MAKRDIIIELVIAGEATKESLMEAAEVDNKGLASQFTYLRLMGKCPVVNENGIVSFITTDEWEAMKEERKANAVSSTSVKTPIERLKAAEKRVTRCEKTNDVTFARYQKDDDNEEYSLRFDLASINLKLANIELQKARTIVENTIDSEDDTASEGDIDSEDNIDME